MKAHEESKSEFRHQRNGFVRTFGLVPTVFVLAVVVLLLWQPITAAPADGESVRAVKTAAVASQAIAMTAVGTPATQPPLAVSQLAADVVDEPRAAQRPKKDAAPEVTDDASRGGGCVEGQVCGDDADCAPGICDPVTLSCICKCAPPGKDCFTTACDGTTFYDFSLNPIPGGFFFAGSPPFAGSVDLGGPAAVPGDTIIQRLVPVCFAGGFPETVGPIPVEVTQLNLVSCFPIDVGGVLFDLIVSLSPGPQPGEMTITKEDALGGTFKSNLTVSAEVIFVPVLLGPIIGPLALPPVSLSTVGPAPWLQDDPGVFCGTSGFFPGWDINPSTGFPCCKPVCHANPNGNHPHCVANPKCPPCPPPDPKACEGKGTACGDPLLDCICETRPDGRTQCAEAADLVPPCPHGACSVDLDCDEPDTKCFIQAGALGCCAHNCGEHVCPEPCIASTDCDDGDPCTRDECDATGCCTHDLLCTTDADCNDGNLCTTDTCRADGCCDNTPDCTTPADCNDNNPCTTDTCDADGCCENRPDCTLDTDCNDNDPCTTDTCRADGCCDNTPDCTTPADCNDGNLCTTDTCRADGCCDNTPDCTTPADCNDGNLCTTDTCRADGCCDNTPDCTTPADCNDNDPCTTDTCDADGCCENRPDCTLDTDCNDGNLCTTDTCDAATGCCDNRPDCTTPADCNDNNFCTTDTCRADGCCDNTLDCTTNADCDDGNPCTTDFCTPTGCCANQPECSTDIACDDNDPCTTDTCDLATGCCNHGPCTTDADCIDNNPCTTDTCRADGCCDNTPDCTTNADCDDGNPCTTDFCGLSGCCANQPECSTDIACDDNNPCTTDTCDLATGCCDNTLDCTTNADCDDGNPCTTDTCRADGCCDNTRDCTTNADCNDNNPCTTDICRSDGCCDNTPECTIDADCNDGDSCTIDTCVAGCCQNTTDPACEACCLPDGTCISATHDDCACLFRGIPQGAGSDCTTVDCPLPQGIWAGMNVDIHQDNLGIVANDFHIEGIVESAAIPIVIDHIDDLFPNFTHTLSQGDPTCPTGSIFWCFTADWSGADYQFCEILHLGLLFEVVCKNVMIDLVGWWTVDGNPIGALTAFEGPGAPGEWPMLGWDVEDNIVTTPPDHLGQSIRLKNGPSAGDPRAARTIFVEILSMDLAVIVGPSDLEASLGERPLEELRLGGLQENLRWVPVTDTDGNIIGFKNPIPMPPGDEIMVLLRPPPGRTHGLPLYHAQEEMEIPPGGYLVARQLVHWIGNGASGRGGGDEFRWFWELHGAHQLPQPEACCFGDGTCQNLPPADCICRGGTPQGQGTACQGDADGDGIDDACEIDTKCQHCGPGSHWVDSCPAGNDFFPSGAVVGLDIDLDCDVDTNLVFLGPASVARGAGSPHSIPTEMVSMNLTNILNPAITLIVGAGLGQPPGLPPSLGQIVEKIDFVTGDSTFDVFFEVHLGGGNYVYNHVALTVQAQILCVPPNKLYTHIPGCLPLFDRPLGVPGPILVANLVTADHQPFPNPKVCEGKGTPCGDPTQDCVCETRFDGTLNCADARDFIDPTRHGTCPNGDADCPTGTKCFVNVPLGTAPVCAHNCGKHVEPDPHITLFGTSATFGAPDVPPIPADFFGPNCDPFVGPVNLVGGPTETLGQRSGPIVCPGGVGQPCNPVSVKLVQLDLVSAAPITAPVCGSQWDVAVDLSPTGTPPLGTLTATLTHANGGTYNAGIPFSPRFTFTEVGNPANVKVLDYGLEGTPPIEINFGGVNWVVVVNPALGISAPNSGNFVPGVRENIPGDPNSQKLIQSIGLSKGKGIDHPVQPPPTGACCLDADGDGHHDTCVDNISQAQCLSLDPGAWFNPGGVCSGIIGSCCLDWDGDGHLDTCTDNVDRDCCLLEGGSFTAGGICSGVIGACCLDADGNGLHDDRCVVMDQDCCETQGGWFMGAGSVCLGDANGNGTDDACELVNDPKPVDPGTPNDRRKNRYISFKPNNEVGAPVRLEVTLTASLPHPGLVGSQWWVQAPVAPGNPLLPAGECVARAGPVATAADIDWVTSGCTVLHVTGCAIEPVSDYDVRAWAGAVSSGPLAVSTILQPVGGKFWGDTVGIFNGSQWTPPNLTTNIDDVVVCIKTWQGGPVVAPIIGSSIAHLSVADVDPGDINLVVNFNDVFKIVQAFQGGVYPFGPADVNGKCP